MSVIYLRHPEHGTKVACSDQEAIYDESNGWVVYDPNTPSVVAAPIEQSVAETTAEAEAPEPTPKRRGRPRKGKAVDHSGGSDQRGA